VNKRYRKVVYRIFLFGFYRLNHACLGSSIVFLIIVYTKWTYVNNNENGNLAVTTVLGKIIYKNEMKSSHI